MLPAQEKAGRQILPTAFPISSTLPAFLGRGPLLPSSKNIILTSASVSRLLSLSAALLPPAYKDLGLLDF